MINTASAIPDQGVHLTAQRGSWDTSVFWESDMVVKMAITTQCHMVKVGKSSAMSKHVLRRQDEYKAAKIESGDIPDKEMIARR